MAAFSRFAQLPTELRLLVWEAAIPRSPSVQFLSYPRPADTAADNAGGLRQNRWQSEIPNAQRTITASENPGLGEPNKQTASFERYSSYMSSLPLLHACRESRGVCRAHSNSSSTVSIGPCASIPIDLDKDIICIQDPTSRLPWASPPQLRLSPELIPTRIAFERRLPFHCEFKYRIQNGHFHVWCDCATDWIDAGILYPREKSFVEAIGCQHVKNRLKVIYVLDYAIKPRHAIAPDTSGTDVQGVQPSHGSQQHGSGPLTANLPVQFSEHNGKFHGHGVTFYALSCTNKTFAGWDIPRKAMKFCANFAVHLTILYGYRFPGVQYNAIQARGSEEIPIEYLACVKD